MQWYYTRDGKQEGPFEEREFFEMARDGRLQPTEFVWNETMGEQWQEGANVPGLFGGDAPPPVPEQPVPVTAASVLQAAQAPREADIPLGPVRPSCTTPVGVAWQRMVDVLFRPFNMAKWFALGFSAWLATLGETSGGGGGGGSNWGGAGQQVGEARGGGGGDFESAIESVRSFLQEHGSTIALVVTLLVVVGLAIGLLVLWLRARGKFMLLDNVVNDRAEIRTPWRVFSQHASSLFKWTIVFALVSLVVFVLFAGVTVLSVVMPLVKAKGYTSAVGPGIALSVLLWFAYAVVFGLVGRFLEDFVIPIMYKSDLMASEAWRKFLEILKPRFWRFVLYALFYLVLTIGAGMAILMLIVVTCCIAGCLMAIPYVGAVVILPVTVFFRFYSLEYLAQFGPEFILEPGGGQDLPPIADAGEDRP